MAPAINEPKNVPKIQRRKPPKNTTSNPPQVSASFTE